MHIYLNNIPAKFHPDSTWDDGASKDHPNKNNNSIKNKMS